ncbi:MAG: GerMN domain-containing protein [Spirochaetaceae bacterium]|nr:GerMN domain-containing protein [Spirochaetaceae bacterium]
MSEKNKKKKYPGVSAIFWTVFALILLILFLVNKNRIFSVLQTTGFFSKVFGTEPEFIQNHPSDDTNKPIAELESSQETTENEPTIVVLNAVSGQATVSSGQPAVSSETSVTAQSVPQNQTQNSSASSNTSSSGTSTVAPNTTQSSQNTTANNSTTSTSSSSADKTAVTVPDTPAPAATSQMKQHLFFIQIDNDGSVLRKESVRTIAKTNTPLTAAITALLDGPNIDEIEKGYISLIPQGTKLLGASVKNGTASINFSDSFRYNQYGVEGYYGQLMQIVYTATAFSNIDNVQFLIEGEKMDYLGLEGVFIGAPLSIASFH